MSWSRDFVAYLHAWIEAVAAMCAVCSMATFYTQGVVGTEQGLQLRKCIKQKQYDNCSNRQKIDVCFFVYTLDE